MSQKGKYNIMSIYRIARNPSIVTETERIVVEFAITEGGRIYIFTEEDVDPVFLETVLNEGKKGDLGGYPPINIKYSGTVYKVDLVPDEDARSGHRSDRIKLSTGKSNFLGTRHISLSDNDPICKRGAISIYRTAKGEKFTDNDKNVNKSNCLLAARGFVYYMIDDIEDYFEKRITRDEMQRLADEKYSKLSKSQQEKYAKLGEKLEKEGV